MEGLPTSESIELGVCSEHGVACPNVGLVLSSGSVYRELDRTKARSGLIGLATLGEATGRSIRSSGS